MVITPPINKETNEYTTINTMPSYDNTLIERDIKDPSPTINATFRVIGNTKIKNQTLNNNESQDEYIPDLYSESDHEYYDQENNYKNNNEFDSILNDWEDDTYLNW